MRRTALLLIIFCTAAFSLIRTRAQPRRDPLVFGQKSIEHLGSAYVGVLLSCSAREAEIRKVILEAIGEPSSTQVSVLPIQRTQSPRMLDTYDAKKAAALFRRFRRNKTWQVPTLALLRAFAYGNDPGFINDPRLKYISPSMAAG